MDNKNIVNHISKMEKNMMQAQMLVPPSGRGWNLPSSSQWHPMTDMTYPPVIAPGADMPFLFSGSSFQPHWSPEFQRNISSVSQVPRQVNESRLIQRGATTVKIELEEEEPLLEEIERPPLNITKRKLRCGMCGKGFKSRLQMRLHAKSHNRKRPYRCLVCTKKFMFKSSFLAHKNHFHYKKSFRCKWCAKVFSNEKVQIDHIQNIHERGGIFPCDICSRKFKKYHNLIAHVKKHSGDTLPFRCQHCGKGFAKVSNLKSHTRRHTGEKPYQCDMCSREFAHLSTYTEHVKRHFGTPYVCQVCGKEYRDKLSFDGHMTLHTGIKPYKCDVCDKEYGWRTSFKFHVRYAHKDRDLECKVCGQKFKMQKALEDHEERHNWPSTYKPFECGECGQKFTTRGSIYRHMRVVHNVSGNVANHIIVYDKPSPEDFEAGMNHGGKYFNCPVCTKMIRLRSSLAKHVRGHNIRIPTKLWSGLKRRATLQCQYMTEYGQYACTICSETKEHRFDMNKHLWAEHEDAITQIWDLSMTDTIKQCKMWKDTMTPEELEQHLSQINNSLDDLEKAEKEPSVKSASNLANPEKSQSKPKPQKKRVRKQKTPNKLSKANHSKGMIDDIDTKNDNTEFLRSNLPNVNHLAATDGSFCQSSPSMVPRMMDFQKETTSLQQNLGHRSFSKEEELEFSRITSQREKSVEASSYGGDPFMAVGPMPPVSQSSSTSSPSNNRSNAIPMSPANFLQQLALKQKRKEKSQTPPNDDSTENLSGQDGAKHELMDENCRTCPVCNTEFETHEMLKYHMRSHPKDCPFKCRICNKNFSSRLALRRHEPLHADVRPHTCDVCGKGYTRRIHLRKHMGVHTGDKMSQCTICGKYLCDNSSLKIHLKIHAGDLQHKCPVCSKAFATGSTLKKHLVIHSGEKPYKCKQCGRGFSQHGHLTSHMRIHSGERPYRCDICPKAFTIGSALKNHMMIHTDTRPWDCSGCDKKFRRKHHLREHLKGTGCLGRGSYEEALRINEERMAKARESREESRDAETGSEKEDKESQKYDSETDEYEFTEEESKPSIPPVTNADTQEVSDDRVIKAEPNEDEDDRENEHSKNKGRSESSNKNCNIGKNTGEMNEAKFDCNDKDNYTFPQSVEVKIEPCDYDEQSCDVYDDSLACEGWNGPGMGGIQVKSEPDTPEYEESSHTSQSLNEQSLCMKQEPPCELT